MTNNDVLRRLRYTFKFNDARMVSLFGLAGYEVPREQVTRWLKRDEDPEYENCGDTALAAFLNGLIIDKRGEREGEPPKPEKKINNNIVFMKIKIALNMKAEDVLAIMDLSGLSISKHELSALSRRPDHKHYRECKDQILRNFLSGLQMKYRDQPEAKAAMSPKTVVSPLYKSKTKPKDASKAAPKETSKSKAPATSKARSQPASKPKSRTTEKSTENPWAKPRAKPGVKPGAKPRAKLRAKLREKPKTKE